MFGGHPELIHPSDENMKIWRYMSISQFLDIIDKKALYFVRVDQFKDYHEGYYSNKNLENIEKLPIIEKDTALKNMRFMQETMRNWLRVNCWSLGEHESSLLWQKYVNNSGIAIQSTFSRIKKSFEETDFLVNAGLVQYRNYYKEEIPWRNGFLLLTHKKVEYESEKELRLLISMKIEKEFGVINYDEWPVGIHVPISINSLIENMIMAPGTPDWTIELLKSIISKYEFSFPVIKSELDSRPPLK